MGLTPNMDKYHKINTIFKRDALKKIIEDDWTLPEFEYLQNCLWNFDEKIDGQNIRVGWDTMYMTIDGRNENSSIPSFLANYLFSKFTPELFKGKFTDPDYPVTLYGEGFGYGIQGQRGVEYAKNALYALKTCGFLLFDVRVGDYWLERHNVKNIAETFKVGTVPELGTGTLNEAVEMCKKGFESQLGKINAEGLVMRPCVEMYNRKGERIIAKLKERDF